MFFLVFHLFLNILGELLLFGDRVFYKVLMSTYESVLSTLKVCHNANDSLPLPSLATSHDSSSSKYRISSDESALLSHIY